MDQKSDVSKTDETKPRCFSLPALGKESFPLLSSEDPFSLLSGRHLYFLIMASTLLLLTIVLFVAFDQVMGDVDWKTKGQRVTCYHEIR